MKKIIILLIALVISPSLVNADHHTIPGIGQGAFNTLMVKAKAPADIPPLTMPHFKFLSSLLFFDFEYL